MFVVVPYRVDTYCKELPWGTLGLIAANIAVALLLGFPSSAVLEAGERTIVDSWVLEFGTLNPLTWVTSAFVHFDWWHVLFNMLFLWAFGFIVEGYVGLQRFVPLYLAMAAAGGALAQILMLGADGGGAAGASGAVYSLMAIAALWAPRNTLTLFVWILIFIRKALEVTVLGFCALWIGIDLLFALLSGFEMSSEMLHVFGAGIGVGAAVLFLENGWVDTEGWDWLSIRKHGPPSRRANRILEKPDLVDPRVQTLVAVQDALEGGNAERAEAAYKAGPADLRLPLEDLKQLVSGLLAAGRVELAVPRMEEWLEIAPHAALRLRLAQEYIRVGQPTRAVAHLNALDGEESTDEQRTVRRKLLARALKSREGGGLELE
ncbi:MAG: rhomboid family intramembrane serine protease [Planctomycetota bacterium]|jgi:membrane associated rhomboid family serine protease